MAKCEYCDREMLTSKGCTFTKIKLENGQVYDRMKVGDEGWINKNERCPDCGAMYGGYHHFGCDVERRPICGSQQLGCSCDITYLVK